MSIVEFESAEWNAMQTYAIAAIDKEEASGFESLDEVERVAFCVWVADGMVENGGMHAVCYNSTGNYLPHLADAFRAIGASRKAATFEKLSRVFGRDGPSLDWERRIKQHESLPERSVSAIDALDDEYFDAPEQISDLLFEYLKQRGKV